MKAFVFAAVNLKSSIIIKPSFLAWKANADFLANLLSQTNNYKSEQDIASEKAKLDAIARRAASLGV